MKASALTSGDGRARATEAIDAITISGFSATAGKPVELSLIRPSGAIDEAARIPFSPLSRPIFDLLAGRATWEETKMQIASTRSGPPPKGASATSPTIALIISDLANPTVGFALRSPISGAVVPALRLSAEATGWNAEPLAIYTDGVDRFVSVRFRSPSVSALLNLADQAFEKLLRQPRVAAANLDYLRKVGAIFTPELPDKRKWTIACRWPDWQRCKLGFPARKIDLGQLDRAARKDGSLRQICSRLRLRISDATDS